MAKKHTLPFPTSDYKSIESFELVHIDIWGPYNKFTHDNNFFYYC